MKIKHKILQDFQFISSDKKIFILKSGTILEEYLYKSKGESIVIDKEIIESNPQFFQTIDWRVEFILFLKSQKIPTPSVFGKKIIPFIEELLLYNNSNQTSTINESDLEYREKRISIKEEEYRKTLLLLDRKDDEIRGKMREISDKELDILDRLQDINERERNLDREELKEVDSKYVELQEKIDSDLKRLGDRERVLEDLARELNSREDLVLQKESHILKIENENVYLKDELNRPTIPR